MVSDVSGQELGQFLTKAVTKCTRDGYAGDWRSWVAFLERSTTSSMRDDVYLDQARNDTEEATILGLFFKERYERGKMKGRQATSPSAGITYYISAETRRVVRVADCKVCESGL